MTTSPISKEESKRLLDHAISYKGITAKKLAEFLGVSEPRVSQGRKSPPEWRLRPEQAAKLIEEYGQPRITKGLFVRAQRARSIGEFLGNFGFQSRKAHLKKILKHVTNNKYRSKLTSILSPTNGESNQQEVISNFENFINSDEFQYWLVSMAKFVETAPLAGLTTKELSLSLSASTYYDFDRVSELDIRSNPINLPIEKGLKLIAPAFGVDIETLEGMDLFLIGQLYKVLSEEEKRKNFELNSDFSFQHHPILLASDLSDFIITGDRVWKKEGFFPNKKYGEPAFKELFIPTHQNDLYKSFAPNLEIRDRVISDEKAWNLDCWASYKVSLFIDSNCNYNLLIELGSDNNFHTPILSIVITTLPGIKIFEELLRLRQWLGLEELPEIEIKQQIAALGGYIPGAQVL